MKLHPALLLLPLLISAACSDKPVIIDNNAPAPAPHVGAGHKPNQTEGPYFAGQIVLTGDLATKESGTIYFSACLPVEPGATPNKIPVLTSRLDLPVPGTSAEGGELRLPFELGSDDFMTGTIGPVPETARLRVLWRPGGFVEKSPGSFDVEQTGQRGQMEIVVRLEPGS